MCGLKPGPTVVVLPNLGSLQKKRKGKKGGGGKLAERKMYNFTVNSIITMLQTKPY